jgi:hypothetical protein
LIRRGLTGLAALIALVIAAGSALIWNARRALRFNPEGRYFDPDTATVVHQQTVEVYAILAVAFGLLAAGLGLMARRL